MMTVNISLFMAGLILVGSPSTVFARVGDSPESMVRPHRRHLQVDPISVSITLNLDESADVTKTIGTSNIPQNLEFCILSDATGSFADDQRNLVAAAPGIATTITAASPNAQFGYAAFKDTFDDFVYSLRQPLTTNTNDWLTAINNLSPNGGGDGPEAQWDGISCATDITFCPTGSKYSNADCGFTDSPTSRKVLVVTTDAPFSNDGDIQNNQASTTSALNGAGVVLIGLKAPWAGNELDALATATGGSVVPLDSNGGNVATAILTGLGNLPTTVVPLPDCPSLVVTFDPPSVTVPSGDNAIFEETIAVTDPILAGTVVTCSVDFFDNGVSVGVQTITITVPLTVDATPETDTNPLCSSHTVNAVLLSGSTPVPGATVTFEVTSGPNTGVVVASETSDDDGLVSFTYGPLGVGPSFLGTDAIAVCSRGVCDTILKAWDLVVDFTPNTATNELGTDNSHTVTTTVTFTSDVQAVVDVPVDYVIVSGPNEGEVGSSPTDASGESTFTFSSEVPVSCDGLGTDVIKACYCGICDEVEMIWQDTTPPEASCIPGPNPDGVIPPAGEGGNPNQNPDGFWTLGGTDDVDSNLEIWVEDTGSNTVFGPYPVGTNIKWTQAPGGRPSDRPGHGEVDWFIKGRGDMKVIAVDCSGNSNEVSCLVPPHPA